MDFEKLDREVREILDQEDGSRSYTEIREGLLSRGYQQEEIQYIMGIVDEKLLSKLDTGESRVAIRNMVLGGILSLTGLGVTVGSYLGQPASKEVYYVSLVVFAVGYLVFRNGYRRRKHSS
jgi:hypothetical protein